MPEKNTRILILAVAVTVLAGGLLFFFLGGRTTPSAEKESLQNSKSFTFFNIGVDTRFSENIRDQLQEKLGSDAIARHTIINLSIPPSGLIFSHFPEIAELNRWLNPATGDRVEHDTIQLTYRYARKQGVPFAYVEVLFSNITEKTLLVRIRTGADGDYLPKALEKNFGPPKTIPPDAPEPNIFYWKKGHDTMILSRTQNRMGQPEYHILVTYYDQLKALVDREIEAARQREAARQKRGSNAF
jgi:hypothetical protein